MVKDISIDNSFDLLCSEFGKLQKTIEYITKKSEKLIPDIVNLYYQAILVQTLTKKIKSDLQSSTISEHQKFLDKIEKIQYYVTDNFSKSLHSEILSQLTHDVQISTNNLKILGQNSEQKTKEIVEKEALLYKELRELMSTKEFVEQYEVGLKDD